jgi:hypothetical protein
MQANKLQELPVAFGHLGTLEMVELEGNPLRSPPPEILLQGMTAIHAYLQKRIKRIEELKMLLTSASYRFHTDHFTPTTQDLFLSASTPFLTPADVRAFETQVDQYVNGAFYRWKDTRAVDIVNGLVQLQFQRAQTARKAVLDDVLALLYLIQKKRYRSIDD